MFQFRAQNKPRIAILLDGRIEITFITESENKRNFEAIPDKELEITVKEYRQKRSLSQNAYMWILLDELGKKLQISKEQVYKTYIRDFGVFEIFPIKNEAVKLFMAKWSKNGLGWFCEDLGESKLSGYTKLVAYFGSSTYNSQEMSRLIDAIVDDCIEQGIDTMTKDDIMLLQNENDTVC